MIALLSGRFWLLSLLLWLPSCQVDSKREIKRTKCLSRYCNFSCSCLSDLSQIIVIVIVIPGVVLVLVVCHTPKTFINLYESYQVTMSRYKMISPIINGNTKWMNLKMKQTSYSLIIQINQFRLLNITWAWRQTNLVMRWSGLRMMHDDCDDDDDLVDDADFKVIFWY